MSELIKPHYVILDGLRGIAALMVLLYHLFEAIAFAAGAPEQDMFNGFLGVDFFFILSGFVMGYAYDDRWTTMSVGNFIKRRLVRLHPMVIMGVIIGVIAFYIQGCEKWDGSHVSTSLIMLGMLFSMFLLPTPTSLEVRGNTEAFPLNGPHWSLFFEYIGSLLYAILLRKLPTRWLTVWVLLSALALAGNGYFGADGGIAYGWSSEPYNLFGGFLRLSFAYPCGLLLARIFREKNYRTIHFEVFGITALVFILLMNVPSFHNITMNTTYQLFCVLLAFPCIIIFAARGECKGLRLKLVSFLGRLSYPLYAVHYPFIYLYIDWINKGNHPFGAHPMASPIAVAIMSICTAVICTFLYDEPVRKYLKKKFL